MEHFFFKTIMLGVILLLFPACDGILDNIYDEKTIDEKEEFGFIEIDEINKSGTISINATSYTRWTYINFHDLSIDSTEITKDMQEPIDWDIAIHRYDAKTNGGEVIETGFTGFDILKASGKRPEGTYVSDEWTTSKIAIDMLGMMEGNIIYAESYYNKELSKWLNVDISNMPPNYSMSNKVYILKLKDNTYAALRLRNFMNASRIKGYMTIEYIYPFEI